ncbi:MAG: hypothetical protein IH614_17080 [Desulfuromonadales bacterium]|nr:hypothetical protein [Desulfuromonadales bacterium]
MEKNSEERLAMFKQAVAAIVGELLVDSKDIQGAKNANENQLLIAAEKIRVAEDLRKILKS